MKILFKSKKWDKEKDEKIRIRNEYYSNNNVSADISIEEININNCIEGYLSGKGRIKDLNSLYYQIGDQYFFMAISDWILYNDARKSALDLYLYLLSKKKSYDLMKKGEKCENPAIQRAMHIGRDYKMMICTAIALDQFELMDNYKKECPIILSLMQHDEEYATQLVDQLPDECDESREVYYTDDHFLKKIYQSILSKDEESFNIELINRIKKLRRNMTGYLTIIDLVSIAMIKLGKEYGLDYHFKVIEIPDYFINTKSSEYLGYSLPEIK